MFDPFAAALAALFRAAGSVAANYTPTIGAAVATRIIWSQGSDVGGGRDDRRVADTNTFDVMRSVIANPTKGDIVDTFDPVTGLPITLRVNGAAILDAEGMTWTCPAQPA